MVMQTIQPSAPPQLVAAMRRVPESVWVAIVIAIAQLPILDRTLVTLDEGQVTAIGHRLASGQILYRDVHTGIFPGVYWFVELLFRIFGTEILVLRWFQLAVNTLIAVALFVLARPLAPARSAWIAPVGYWILVVLSFPVFTMLTYSPLSLLAALGALLCCRRYVEHARVLDGIGTGVLLGAATIVKQNFGGLALLAVLASALWTRRDGRLAAVSSLRAFGIPIAAGVAVAVLTVMRLVASEAWPTFLNSTFVTIVGSQLDAFNQPLPPLFGPHPEGGVFYFLYGPGGMFGAMFQGDPLATTATISMATRLGYGSAYLALLLAPLLAWRTRREADLRARLTARIVFPFAVIFFLGIFPSAIWSHLAAVYPPLLVVLAIAAGRLLQRLDRENATAAGVFRYGGFAAAVVLIAFAGRLEMGIRHAFAAPLNLPSTGLHIAPRDVALYRESDAFLKTCAAKDEPVFVAPYMPLLYVTSGRPNPTPYDLLISTDVDETAVVDKLESSRVRCMVYNPAMYVQFEPFEKTYPELAEYLASKFVEAGSVVSGDAEWKFLRRRQSTISEEPR